MLEVTFDPECTHVNKFLHLKSLIHCIKMMLWQFIDIQYIATFVHCNFGKKGCDLNYDLNGFQQFLPTYCTWTYREAKRCCEHMEMFLFFSRHRVIILLSSGHSTIQKMDIEVKPLDKSSQVMHKSINKFEEFQSLLWIKNMIFYLFPFLLLELLLANIQAFIFNFFVFK